MSSSSNPSSFPTLALITDFGNRDGFAGIVKGMIYRTIQSACPHLSSQMPHPAVIDITHEIPPFDIRQGAWVLGNCFGEFPEHTIFVCIVDPNVGEVRQRAILLHWPEHKQFFIGPDNGIFTPVIELAGDNFKAFEIQNTDLFRQIDGKPCVSQTFHARDVYGPVAGHLANALMHFMAEEFLHTIGPKITDLKTLEMPKAQQTDQTLKGHVVYSDVFGNLITNIPCTWLDARQPVDIQITDKAWHAHRLGTYAEGQDREDVFIVPSSNGMLELALYKRSARETLRAVPGDPVTFRLKA